MRRRSRDNGGVEGYRRLAIVVHWIIAVSIFFLFVSSWWMMSLPLPSEELRFREFPFQLHKNIGITLVALAAVLIHSRFRHPPRGGAAPGGAWRLAALDHVLLYLLIVAVAASGYLSSAHTRWDTVVWWTVKLPRISEPDERLNMFWSDIHLWTAWALLVVIALHICGALYHAFRGDGIVRRMLRW